MLAIERQQQILSLLDAQGTLRTIDLAERFAVTDETIRRDLQQLASNRLLTRIHGGASSLNGRPKLRSFTERRTTRVEAKKAIAKAALKWIHPGLTYAFDSSTTAFELVCILPDLPYRIVTNAYAVMDHLVRLEQVELINTGGRYHPKTQTFIGAESLSTVRNHNINTAFVSCIGLDPQRGASEGFEEQAGFKQVLVNMAEQVVLLVDSSKLNMRSEYFFASIETFSHIITDSEVDPKTLEKLKIHCGVTAAQIEPAT
jgi:DeoR/GlpR family transcriptional regulator of sugar metabolism